MSAGQPQGQSPVPPASANTSYGSVAAFRAIRRELSEADMAHPGVQRLMLDRLDAALAQCERLSSFEGRYHDADKQVGVLEEKLKKRLGLDLAWGVGVAVGLTFVTLAPVAWGGKPDWVGPVFLVLGALLIAGGIAIRWRLQ